MFEQFGVGMTLFFLAFSAAVAGGVAGAPNRVNGVAQGPFHGRAALLGLVLGPIGALSGWWVAPNAFGLLIGAFVGGLFAGMARDFKARR